MNTQYPSFGTQSQPWRTPYPLMVSGYAYDSSIAEPQQHGNRYAQLTYVPEYNAMAGNMNLTYGPEYNATPSNMNQTRRPYDQSSYTREPVLSETNPDQSDDFAVDEGLSTEGAYRQSDHQQGYKPPRIEGNVHRGAKNQYLGIRIPAGRRMPDEVMLRASADMLVRNNLFARQGGGNQVIGQSVPHGGLPSAFSGQYQGNINEGPGHQIIGISFESWAESQN
ncbi:hypothetical protein GGS24DRAFT_239712 [Hypoxylon argillaceum]|nr:hypothetical protein GGS24DRAFT_239712 [Hypoxylon argillaceum]KAI1146811.1 hypothetical protein F4825DRAFT_472131 [Nemania diffusa]